MITPFIAYIVPIIDDDKKEAPFLFSPFQGFSYGIFNIGKFIEKILSLPSNLNELFLTRSQIIATRMAGGSYYKILPIQIKYLSAIYDEQEMPFKCFFSDEKTYSDVHKYISIAQSPILHVTTTPQSKHDISLEDFDRTHVYNYVKHVVQNLELMKGPIQSLSVYKNTDISINGKQHLVTLPNQLVLSSFNFNLTRNEPFKGMSDEVYIDAVIDSANAIIAKRQEIIKLDRALFPPAMTLILTATSMYRDIYRIKKQSKIENDNFAEFEKLFRLIQKQKSFCFHSSPKLLEKILFSDIGKLLFGIRIDETVAYTAAVSIMACNNFCPTLRFPPLVNSIHSDLEQLGKRARGNGKKIQYKTNKLFKRISEKLTSHTPRKYLDLIDNNQNSHIKVITDVPLEWISVRDLPLMLRYDTSRIPTTPGNLLFSTATSGNPLILTPQDFQEVLVIRSFKETDKLRNILKGALTEIDKPISFAHFKNALNKDKKHIASSLPDTIESDSMMKIKISWKDVSTEAEFIDALNDFSGALMIFDGHGVHDKADDIGSLVINEKHIDMINIKNIARIPPIVLLSACDTHPIDRSHASTANAFLIGGATTVLGTFLPIEARKASIFIARLVLRLKKFLPDLVDKGRRTVRWSTLLTGLLRMSYITEIYFTLVEEGILKASQDEFYRFSSGANHYINTNNPHWYELSLELISTELNKTTGEIKSMIHHWAKLTECLKYVQLGNPDQIIIANIELAKAMRGTVNI